MTSCSTWAATLESTVAINVRHYCVLSHQRFVVPETIGDCTASAPCTSCYAFDGSARNDCNYIMGTLGELQREPPTIGYQDFTNAGTASTCYVGYEVFFRQEAVVLECPIDSVMLVEIFPPVVDFADLGASNITFEVARDVSTSFNPLSDRISCNSVEQDGRMATATNCTFPSVETAFSQQACLSFVASHDTGNCRVVGSQSSDWNVECGGDEVDAAGMGGCSSSLSSQLSCDLLNSTSNPAEELLKECGLGSITLFQDSLAIAAGAGVFVIVSVLGLWYGCITEAKTPFYISVFMEAISKGVSMITVFSTDWVCLYNGGTSMTENLLFPYAILGFLAAELALSLIAICPLLFRKGGKFVTFDDLKFDNNNNIFVKLIRGISIAGFGGFGGFVQCTSIVDILLQGEDGPLGRPLWIALLGCSIIGIHFSLYMFCAGVCSGFFKPAWNAFRMMLADIPSLIFAATLAPSLLVAWSIETANDVLQFLLTL